MSTDDAGKNEDTKKTDAQNTDAQDKDAPEKDVAEADAAATEAATTDAAATSVPDKDVPDKDVQPDPTAEDSTVSFGKSDAEPTVEPTPAAAAPTPAAAAPAPAAGATAQDSKGRSSLVPLIAAFVSGVLLVAAVTAVVIFYRQAHDRGQQLDAHADATRAACEYGKLISTYDPQTIDDYLKKVDAASAGDWKDQFAKLGQDLKGVVVDAKAQSSTYDMQCGFQSGDKDSANVLVVIGQTTTNVNITAANKPPSKVELVVVAGLRKSGDKWLVDKFDLPILKQMGN